MHVTCEFGIGGARVPVCPSEPRENDAFKTLARALHVHHAPQPPSSYGAKLALPRCTHVPSLLSLAQSSLSPEDPTSKQLLRPWRVQLVPHWNSTPNGF